MKRDEHKIYVSLISNDGSKPIIYIHVYLQSIWAWASVAVLGEEACNEETRVGVSTRICTEYTQQHII